MEIEFKFYGGEYGGKKEYCCATNLCAMGASSPQSYGHAMRRILTELNDLGMFGVLRERKNKVIVTKGNSGGFSKPEPPTLRQLNARTESLRKLGLDAKLKI